MLDEFRQMGREQYVSAYDRAMVHVGTGNYEKAMHSLRAAEKEHAFWLIALPIEPFSIPCGETRNSNNSAIVSAPKG